MLLRMAMMSCDDFDISPKMDTILKQLWNSCDSASLAVAEYISTIALNGEAYATDEFLVSCTRDMLDVCAYIIKQMEASNEST